MIKTSKTSNCYTHIYQCVKTPLPPANAINAPMVAGNFSQRPLPHNLFLVIQHYNVQLMIALVLSDSEIWIFHSLLLFPWEFSIRARSRPVAVQGLINLAICIRIHVALAFIILLIAFSWALSRSQSISIVFWETSIKLAGCSKNIYIYRRSHVSRWSITFSEKPYVGNLRHLYRNLPWITLVSDICTESTFVSFGQQRHCKVLPGPAKTRATLIKSSLIFAYPTARLCSKIMCFKLPSW